MADKKYWLARIKRTFTSFLPVMGKRSGKCIHCGMCCKLPKPCPFLKKKKNGTFHCKIYALRPLNCKKYPRAEEEFITHETCGYRFE